MDHGEKPFIWHGKRSERGLFQLALLVLLSVERPLLTWRFGAPHRIVSGRLASNYDLLCGHADIIFQHRVFVRAPKQIIHNRGRLFGIIYAKINGFWWWPNICDFMIDWLIDWLIDLITIHDWFTLFHDMHTIILCLFTNLCFLLNKSVHHSGTLFASHIHLGVLFWFLFGIYWFIYQSSYLLHFISRDPSLGT